MTDRIGHYEVLGLLGQGGMGTVYRGRDPRFDREVAIKVLHEQFRHDPGVVERFKSEAVIQAKLNHPHIVSVLDFVADDRHLAMVMERVEGESLERVIESAGGPLQPERAVRLMQQVLSAMTYAHERGLVHRDIKPSNILVQTVSRQEYAKVADFGIAKILGSEKVRTATGAKMGTLAYMSPEHVQSPKRVDARSDVYSLGVVLYEMLTGRVPFDADSEYTLMRLIVEEPPSEALRRASGSIPLALVPVLARAMAKEPSERHQDCEEMRQDLERAARTSAASVPTASPAAGPAPSAGPTVATVPPGDADAAASPPGAVVARNGLLWFSGGIAATLVSEWVSGEGQRHVLFWGAIFFGAFDVVRGVKRVHSQPDVPGLAGVWVRRGLALLGASCSLNALLPLSALVLPVAGLTLAGLSSWLMRVVALVWLARVSASLLPRPLYWLALLVPLSRPVLWVLPDAPGFDTALVENLRQYASGLALALALATLARRAGGPLAQGLGGAAIVLNVAWVLLAALGATDTMLFPITMILGALSDALLAFGLLQIASGAQAPGERDVTCVVRVARAQAIGGTEVTVPVAVTGRMLSVKVPPGARDGMRLRCVGEGAPGTIGHPPGDLYVVLRFEDGHS